MERGLDVGLDRGVSFRAEIAMPTVNGQPYPANRWRESGGTVLTAGAVTDGEFLKRSGTTITSAAVSGGGSPQALAGGRLTLSTGTPVTTTNLASRSTLYYTPYIHDLIGNYNGSSWDAVTFTELSLALTGLTSGKNYDVLFYKNSGTNTIDLMPAWTNDTTRASAIAPQNGVWTNSGSITTVINGHSVSANRGTLLGTIRTSGTTTTEDSSSMRFVWNAANAVQRFLSVAETTDSWTYTSSTVRQVRATSTNKVEYVCGLLQDVVEAHAKALASWSTEGGAWIMSGVGVDSTSVNSALIFAGYTQSSTNSDDRTSSATGTYVGYPGLGYHYLAWLEATSASSDTVTWYGDRGGGGIKTGLVATIMG